MFAAALGLALIVAAAPVAAAPYPVLAYTTVPQLRVTLDQAVSIARRQVDGRVVGADTRSRRGRIVHEVKVLTDDGTLHVIRVDGETGRVSR